MAMTDVPLQSAPHIVTELPGPRARAVIELDEQFTSKQLTVTIEPAD